MFVNVSESDSLISGEIKHSPPGANNKTKRKSYDDLEYVSSSDAEDRDSYAKEKRTKTFYALSVLTVCALLLAVGYYATTAGCSSCGANDVRKEVLNGNSLGEKSTAMVTTTPKVKADRRFRNLSVHDDEDDSDNDYSADDDSHNSDCTPAVTAAGVTACVLGTGGLVTGVLCCTGSCDKEKGCCRCGGDSTGIKDETGSKDKTDTESDEEKMKKEIEDNLLTFVKENFDADTGRLAEKTPQIYANKLDVPGKKLAIELLRSYETTGAHSERREALKELLDVLTGESGGKPPLGGGSPTEPTPNGVRVDFPNQIKCFDFDGVLHKSTHYQKLSMEVKGKAIQVVQGHPNSFDAKFYRNELASAGKPCEPNHALLQIFHDELANGRKAYIVTHNDVSKVRGFFGRSDIADNYPEFAAKLDLSKDILYGSKKSKIDELNSKKCTHFYSLFLNYGLLDLIGQS